MTNPDNVGGLPELPAWMDDYKIPCDAFDGNEDVRLSDRMRAYGELCRAAPAGGDALKRIKAKLLQAGAKYPVQNHGTIESAVNTGLSIALLLVDGELDSDDFGSSVGPVACPECKAPGLLFECVSCSHSNYPKDAAPAGSGEVVVPAIERMLVDAYAAGMNGDNFDMLAARRNLSALLRKLQQGADYVMVPRAPTEAMVAAFCRLDPNQVTEFIYYGGLTGYDHYTTEEGARTVWETMIAASQDQEGGHGNR